MLQHMQHGWWFQRYFRILYSSGCVSWLHLEEDSHRDTRMWSCFFLKFLLIAKTALTIGETPLTPVSRGCSIFEEREARSRREKRGSIREDEKNARERQAQAPVRSMHALSRAYKALVHGGARDSFAIALGTCTASRVSGTSWPPTQTTILINITKPSKFYSKHAIT